MLVTDENSVRTWEDKTHYRTVQQIFFENTRYQLTDAWKATVISGSLYRYTAPNEKIGLEFANDNLFNLLGAKVTRWNKGKYESIIINYEHIVTNEYIKVFDDECFLKIYSSGQTEFYGYHSSLWPQSSIFIAKIEKINYHPLHPNDLPSTFNKITLIDKVNKYPYVICVKDGSLATYCAIKVIEITSAPTKIEYTVGEQFDPTGMIVTAIAYDGTAKEITNYTLDNTTFTAEGEATVVISYTTEDNDVYTANVVVTVSATTE